MSEAPNPPPPPKRSEEERRFRSLLRKLVAVPVEEVHEKRKEFRKERKRREA